MIQSGTLSVRSHLTLSAVSRKRWQDLILPAKRSCVDHALGLTFAETDQPPQVGLHVPTVLLGDQVINAVSAFAEVELNPGL